MQYPVYEYIINIVPQNQPTNIKILHRLVANCVCLLFGTEQIEYSGKWNENSCLLLETGLMRAVRLNHAVHLQAVSGALKPTHTAKWLSV